MSDSSQHIYWIRKTEKNAFVPKGGTTGQFLSKTSGTDDDLEWATVVSGEAAVQTHEAAPDPHPGYLTQGEGDALYEPIGTAASEVADHEAASDPHPGYLTPTEGDAAYATVGHSHSGLAPAGGTTGQLLAKNSNTDYDYGWADPGGPGGQAFPVGSVFIAVVSTDPATLLGYGTWAAIAAGRVLVGLDSGDPDFDTVEETGGSKSGTPSGVVSAPTTSSVSGGTPAGTIAWPAGVPTFAGDALAGHTHTFTGSALGTHTHTFTGSAVASGQANAGATSRGATASTITIGTHTHSVTAAGTNSAVSAGTPAGTLNSISGGTPSGTIAWPAGVPTFAGSALAGHTHTVSAPTFTGDAMSVVQPYFVVYMWKRTA
jgi:hypothetical protein